ncbi:toxin-antitoxin system HicB family antitoxin [Streptomyces alfalfae]|uniref:Histidine kinase n=1 Tax=Streptomyces alfalfae TaxID=1642299 RepID=A0A1P8TEZ0_9ACTN|nr:YlcI/YnfO family protein [Streptomyces alfalfae]AYA16568.1 toxin-antitoxin system HicB family antitoxin [Streptomyces fradiae]APY86187.1 histidine kinase [Streptomyces alfalfae]QQC91570.1 toxin-antitoxin system HicB family antitoxin [Streptomyces alfalfae]QUI34052.1 toxin-antitoxin system HicB family antitoxin [Streptomyces alfalfae]RXX48281.1 toxin-antitoxin system HicB family antitoxin [Streptomyces alfalfae]
MNLTQYVDQLRRELAVAAEAGGDEARELAERLTAPLESAARLTLLNALSAAADEITSDLAPGSVDVRLRGLDPEFVVTPPPAAEGFDAQAEYAALMGLRPPLPPAPPAGADAPDDGGTARINLRLPAHVKARAEEAANREGLSLNAWLVRAVAGAVEQPGRSPGGGGRQGAHTHGNGFTGWVR